MTLAAADDGRLTREAPRTGPVIRETVTRERLVADLRSLGLRATDRPLLVHASLRHIGQVAGGARTVVGALREALGPDGTLVAGAGTPENSRTSRAFRAMTDGFTPEQLGLYQARMPAFNRAASPTTIGAIAEALRTTPGAVRSAHPQSSFAAIGRQAGALMARHRLTCHLGESSPLAKLYQQDASTLFLGVDYQACSGFHLAEYRYRQPPPAQVYACVIKRFGRRYWKEYTDVVLDDSDFDIIGKCFENERPMPVARIGNAESRLVPLRSIVDFATKWMKMHR